MFLISNLQEAKEHLKTQLVSRSSIRQETGPKVHPTRLINALPRQKHPSDSVYARENAFQLKKYESSLQKTFGKHLSHGTLPKTTLAT